MRTESTGPTPAAPISSDRLGKTLLVAILVALFGSILVSGSAILLRPRIQANLEQERQKNLLDIVRRLPGSQQMLDRVGRAEIEAVVVELTSGDIDRTLSPALLDARLASQNAVRNVAIPPERDVAGLKHRSTHQVVYLVRSRDVLRLIVLPVRGQGYASTLHGFVGLAEDANTVVGISFFEHGETPGLGALIDSPQWRVQWQGKRVNDPNGRLRVGVARGKISPGDPDSAYQVDGLTGATYTSQGVHNLLRFWLGDDGFGPFLRRLRVSGVQHE